ncbi:alpha/beta hydrolase [Bradyrhizobium sp. INPA01-394B]|uniref:Alpha/beta hydrolase n=1 Tax=Bradyrhizobium campsiandrae TaxID=1729892 RepID=A0ABR7U0R4_9BRAD|nr:alpha/beta hydrolase [Bradyrhizobium campsiandrae]MBC9875879.1 alpha/beta hydrolase [Bradyrhizobium campsiandrae]MBC9977012.1 alpha/beta hydrolase [Bradyrhizobium campsiandrae]
MPRKAARRIGVSLLGVAGVLVIAAAAALGFRAYRQHLAAETLAIRSPNGVQEGAFVDIGGIKQWIVIRGEDRANPVLLFVHGGPGGSTLPISSGWRPWEKHFTVVQWDQRGTGRTYGAAGEDTLAPTMTLERMTQDGIELVEYLRSHLHKDKIVLVGHSWGSFLGIHIVKQRPDLFYAYVGTGQVVGRVTFETSFELAIVHLQQLAQSAGNGEALTELAPLVARPVMTPENRLVADKWSKTLGLPSIESFQLAGPVPPPFMPDFSLLDWYYWRKGMAFSAKYLRGRDGPMFKRDIRSLGPAFSIPVVLIEGDADYNTPSGPAEQFFDQITAPYKEFVRVAGGEHFIPFDRPDQFLAALLTYVKPLAHD